MIIYTVSVAAVSYRLNRSSNKGFRVKKFRNNYISGWSMQVREIVIAVNVPNIKKAESIINYSINNIKQ